MTGGEREWEVVGFTDECKNVRANRAWERVAGFPQGA